MSLVHRTYTIEELGAGERCLICGAPAKQTHSAELADGASTLELAAPLLPIALCTECGADQIAGLRLGRVAIMAAILSPIAFVVVVSYLAPEGRPWIIPGAGLVGFVLAWIVVRVMRVRRAHALRVLVLGGIGDEALVQLRVPTAPSAHAPYRGVIRETRKDGLEVTSKELAYPRVRWALPLLGSMLGATLLSLVGWKASYRHLTIDNPPPVPPYWDRDIPSAKQLVGSIDGRNFEINGDGRRSFAVRAGHHELRLGNADPVDIFIPYGQDAFISSRTSTCYSSINRASRGPLPAGDGVLYELEEGGDLVRIPCATPFSPFR